jgi:hypothetical protein
MEHNINSNKSAFSEKVSIRPGVLDWDQRLTDQLPDETGFDLVVYVVYFAMSVDSC